MKLSPARKSEFNEVAKSLHLLLSNMHVNIEHCEQYLQEFPKTLLVPENLKVFYKNAKEFDSEYTKYKLYS